MFEIRNWDEYTKDWNEEKLEIMSAYDLCDELEYEEEFVIFEKMFDKLITVSPKQAESLTAIYKFSAIEVVEQYFETGLVYGSYEELGFEKDQSERFNIECYIYRDYRDERNEINKRTFLGLETFTDINIKQ